MVSLDTLLKMQRKHKTPLQKHNRNYTLFRAIAEELAKERGKLPEGSDKSDHDLAHMKRICASYSGKQVYIQSQSNPLLYNLKQILFYTYKKVYSFHMLV